MNLNQNFTIMLGITNKQGEQSNRSKGSMNSSI